LFVLTTIHLTGEEGRPNILWITSEDNDAAWLGCYGDVQASTPHLDDLAERSLRYENFYSNAPVCAVARSTILTGSHAVTQGTQHMRSRHPIPSRFMPVITQLREVGYYCTNNSKTDYNYRVEDKSLWDQCGRSAHYRMRKEGQPFFSIFNITLSHESSLFPERYQKRIHEGILEDRTRLDAAALRLRPYLPDLPEVRKDSARYYDIITAMDKEVGKLLAELESSGLAEDTIVFYFSDHGGILPRGKRYLYNTGVRVPFIVHLPKKWAHLGSTQCPAVVSEAGSFLDLAPSLHALVGLSPAPHHQGESLFRKWSSDEEEIAMKPRWISLYGDRFDEIYGMRRGVTNGKWKYIRRFTPHLAAAPYSFYQFGQEGWTAWRKAAEEGKLEHRFQVLWESPQVVEELYDLEKDPWEINNLADSPQYEDQCEQLRVVLRETLVKQKDCGFAPEPFWAHLAPKSGIADYAQESLGIWPELIDLALSATDLRKEFSKECEAALAHSNPLFRYWGLYGCVLRSRDSSWSGHWPEESLKEALEDPMLTNRLLAAQALARHDTKNQPSSWDFIVNIAQGSGFDAMREEEPLAQLVALNILLQENKLERLSPEKLAEIAADGSASNYVNRMAERLLK